MVLLCSSCVCVYVCVCACVWVCGFVYLVHLLERNVGIRLTGVCCFFWIVSFFFLAGVTFVFFLFCLFFGFCYFFFFFLSPFNQWNFRVQRFKKKMPLWNAGASSLFRICRRYFSTSHRTVLIKAATTGRKNNRNFFFFFLLFIQK